MKSNYLLLACICAMFSIHSLQAQFTSPMQSFPTPQAASFGIYNEIPVNAFTGIPNIEIPFYVFRNKDISVPISLSYHPSGVKPSMHPSWVGLGWNLLAGGCITRRVNGDPDERQKVENNFAEIGYFGRYSNLNRSDWCSGTNVNRFADETKDGHEVSPDEFSFNFCGYSGTFYLDHTGNWQVHSDADIKVLFNKNTDCIHIDDVRENLKGGMRAYNAKVVNRRLINTMTLVTPDGTQYKFGGKDATEYSIPYYSQKNGLFVATSWFLSEITSVNGNKITLTYEPGDPVFEAHPIYGTVVTSGHNTGCLTRGNNNCKEIIVMFPVYLTRIAIDEQRFIEFSSQISNKFNLYPDSSDSPSSNPNKDTPNQILAFNNDFLKIDDPTKEEDMEEQPCGIFYYKEDKERTHSNFINPQSPYEVFKWRKLIYIYICNGTVQRQLTFAYDNKFYSTSDRLMLSEVFDKAFDNGGTQKYTFSYNGLKIVWPAYFTDQEDHWGFYNASSELSGQINIGQYPSHREPSSNLDVRTSKVLSSIIYPSGKKTVFTYEKNDYSQYMDKKHTLINNNYSLPTGGIRIKNIQDYFDGKLTESRSFYYINNFSSLSDTLNLNAKISSGILAKIPEYTCTFTFNSSDFGNHTFDFFSSGTLAPYLCNVSGSHVGYSNVIEVTKDKDGKVMGYKKYNFSNFGNDRWGSNHNNESPIYRTPFPDYRMNRLSDKSFERGRLLSEELYSANNILKKRVLYKYAKSPGQDYVRGLSYSSILLGVFNYAPRIFHYMDAYKIYTCAYRLTEKVETTYEGENAIELTDKYTYGYNNHLYMESHTIGKGKTKETTYKYPKDYVSENVYMQMRNKNIVVPIEERTALRLTSGIYKFLQKEKFNYSLQNSIPYLSSYQKAVKTESKLIEYYRCHRIDAKGNPLYISQRGGPNTVFIWSDDLNYPVAEIKNATYDQVQTALTDKTNLPMLYKALPKAQITLFDFTADGQKEREQDARQLNTRYKFNTRGWLTKIVDYSGSAIEQYEYGFRR